MFPNTRMRRLRRTEGLRRLVRETRLDADKLICPIFVQEGGGDPVAIDTMPGVQRIPEAGLGDEVGRIADQGIGAVILFGVSEHKDAIGSDTLTSDGLMARMTRAARAARQDMTVIVDACFCEYTDHGHCGALCDDGVDNDKTLANLAAQAVVAADAGADIVAPSGMMDGQVTAIRAGLDDHGHTQVPIMSYSSKFSSSFYGPFREAAGSSLGKGDRAAYQMDPANGRESCRESLIDVAEGADILLVKPGMPYLDVVARVRDRTDLPICAYQVSGEYSMIRFAAAAGAIDEDKAILESLTAFHRAGADMVITYFAERAAALILGR